MVASSYFVIQIPRKQINCFPWVQSLSIYSYRYSTCSLGKSDYRQMLFGQ